MNYLKTKRLILRPLQAADLTAFAAYRSDPDVARYQSWTPPYTLDQAAALFMEMNRAPAGTPVSRLPGGCQFTSGEREKSSFSRQ